MLYSLCRRVLFSMQPETAHNVTMANLDWATHLGLHKLLTHMPDEDPVEVMGLRFPNTIGLAAGMDKDGIRVNAFGALGFGHVEIGTITPLAQPGNPKPRCFRVIPAKGIINRMGLDKVYDHADYIAVNISSPNTKNLRQLQGADKFDHLVSGIVTRRQQLKDARNGKHVPIAVKLAPDLENEEILRCVDTLIERGIDAVIATNTTITRDRIQGMPNCTETGGLSGAPLRERSTEVVRLIADHVQGALPIIASGGVMTPQDAVEKMEAGAKLLQLYTGFIYSGPALIAECSEAVARWRAAQKA